MKRIGVICEGPTELRFVKDCLLPYCWEQAGQMLTATVISGKDHQHRGGNVSAERLARAIWRQIPNFDGVTTLVDYYGFKHLGERTKADVEADILQSLARDCHCGGVRYARSHQQRRGDGSFEASSKTHSGVRQDP